MTDVAESSSGSPRLVSERPGLHLSRFVLVHRGQGDDGGGDVVTLRPPLEDSLNVLIRQTLAGTIPHRFNGWCETWQGLFPLS